MRTAVAARHGHRSAATYGCDFGLIVLLAVASCASPSLPTHPPAPIGSSASQLQPTDASATHPSQRWERFDEMGSWPDASAKEFVSSGHLDGRKLAQIRVNPEARDAYLALIAGAQLPVGSSVAEIHRDARTGQRGPIFAMQKIAADQWEFVVVDPDGRELERGRLPLCERCHAEAVADRLFGVPQSAR